MIKASETRPGEEPQSSPRHPASSTQVIFGDDPAILRSSEQWLNEQGYRVEYETAKALEDAGFEATLGAMLPGTDGTERDIDVLARSRKCELIRRSPYECTWVEFAVLVECKYSKRKPWVMMGDAKRPGLERLLAALPHSRPMRSGRNATRRATARAPLHSLQSMRDAFGRGLVVAHSQHGDKDAHRALQKVTDVSWTVARRAPVADVGRGVVIVLPLIVVDGWLLASDYSSDDKRFRVQRRKIGHLLWSGPGLPPTLVDVVEHSSLPAYLKLLQVTRDEVIAFAAERLKAAPARLAGTPETD